MAMVRSALTPRRRFHMSHVRSGRAANVVLENAAERVYVGDCYGDLPIKGWFVVRAENVVLLGELDPARQDADVKHLKRVDTDIIVKLRKVQREKEEERRKVRRSRDATALGRARERLTTVSRLRTAQVMLDFVDELMIGDDGF